MYAIERRMRCGSGLLAVLLLVAPSMAATTFVLPGYTGTNTFPLNDLTQSADAVSQAQLKVTGAPSFFSVSAGSVLGPQDVAKGDTQNFVVNYAIATNAPDGPFSVTLTFSSPNVDLSGFTTTVQFLYCPVENATFLA